MGAVGGGVGGGEGSGEPGGEMRGWTRGGGTRWLGEVEEGLERVVGVECLRGGGPRGRGAKLPWEVEAEGEEGEEVGLAGERVGLTGEEVGALRVRAVVGAEELKGEGSSGSEGRGDEIKKEKEERESKRKKKKKKKKKKPPLFFLSTSPGPLADPVLK